MNPLHFFVLILVLFVALAVLAPQREGYIPEYMNYKSKCFSCEAQAIAMYGEDEAWRANPAKSFAAEREAVEQGGPANGFLAKTLKYY